jgi:uncharacterized protein YuzE
MGEPIGIHYDPEVDLLEIFIGRPQEAISEEAADDIFVHYNTANNEVVGFTVLNLRRHFEMSEEPAVIPLAATFVPIATKPDK